MNSLILTAAVRFLMPILLMFSLFLLFRGHHLPGGGFVGGLVAAAAFSLYAIAYDVNTALKLLRINPLYLIASGLILSLGSALLALFRGQKFFTGLWSDYSVPALGKIGTPVFFDIGVYFVVLGAGLMIILTLAEE